MGVMSRVVILVAAGSTQCACVAALGPREQRETICAEPGARPRGMGWPSGFAVPANALRAKEAGDGF